MYKDGFEDDFFRFQVQEELHVIWECEQLTVTAYIVVAEFDDLLHVIFVRLDSLWLLDEVHVDYILVVLLSEVLRYICFTALADAHNHQWLVPWLVFPRDESVFNFPFQHGLILFPGTKKNTFSNDFSNSCRNFYNEFSMARRNFYNEFYPNLHIFLNEK